MEKEKKSKGVEQKPVAVIGTSRVEQNSLAVVTPQVVYTTNPKLLILYGSLVTGKLIDAVSGGSLQSLNFTHGNEYLCEIVMLSGAPGGFNHWAMSATSKFSITNGVDIVYVNATSIVYVGTPVPKLTFQLKLDSSALTLAMANATILPVVLEFQCILTPNVVPAVPQKFTATSEQTIRRSALFTGVA